MVLMIGYPVIGFVLICLTNCILLIGGLGSIYGQNFIELLINFRDLDYPRNFIYDRLGLGFSFFKRVVIS